MMLTFIVDSRYDCSGSPTLPHSLPQWWANDELIALFHPSFYYRSFGPYIHLLQQVTSRCGRVSKLSYEVAAVLSMWKIVCTTTGGILWKYVHLILGNAVVLGILEAHVKDVSLPLFLGTYSVTTLGQHENRWILIIQNKKATLVGHC